MHAKVVKEKGFVIDEWSCTVKKIRNFTRKIRAWQEIQRIYTYVHIQTCIMIDESHNSNALLRYTLLTVMAKPLSLVSISDRNQETKINNRFRNQ